MLITLSEAKLCLRLEQGYTDEDALLQTLITAAEEYLVNATGRTWDSTHQLARVLVQVLVADWYENREAIGRATDRVRPIVTSIMAQLQNCYPVDTTTT